MASVLVEKILNSMTLEQKVGQLLCYGICGTYPYPDILDVIEKYHVAGLRVTPHARKFQRYFGDDNPASARVVRPPEPRERRVGTTCGPTRLLPRDYARVLNTLRKRSLETGAGIPLYYSLDYEGNGSSDFIGPNMYGVPHPMGLAAVGDPDLTRRVGRLVGRQLKAVGLDWVHSPDLDVNTDPSNPEINTRSFSPDPKVCADYGLQMFLGYRDGNLIATGKHFPGRGHSSNDAHFDVPLIHESAERMRNVHLAAYKPAIEAGMPAIMLAHSVYPSLDPSNEISTLSKAIVTGLLREELGYQRVIITDSFTMGGLVKRYEVAEAAIRTFEAGVDLILLKDENALRGEVYQALLKAVQTRRLTEERITDSVRRTLEVKEEYGMLSGKMGMVDLDEMERVLADPEHAEICRESSSRTVCVLKNVGQIPLKPGARVAVFEEVLGNHRRYNSPHMHLGSLYEALLERGVNATFVDYDDTSLEQALPIMKDLAASADVIVYTGCYTRQDGSRMACYRQVEALGKPTVFITNSPYPRALPESARNVIIHFNPVTETMNHIADILTGRAQAEARLRFDPTKVY
jgi:beta-N-acetylhexosaminidase